MSDIEALADEPTTIMPAPELPLSALPLGEILVRQAGLSPAHLDEALRVQQEKGGRIGRVLVDLKRVQQEQVARALAAQLELEFVARVAVEEVDVQLLAKVPIAFAKSAGVLPIKALEDGPVLVAVTDPTNTAGLDQLRLRLGTAFEPIVTSEPSLLDAINLAYERAQNETQRIAEDLDDANLEGANQDVGGIRDLLDSNDDAPIIRFVDDVLKWAVRERASDIHIEPYEKELVVRFRVDGVLKQISRQPKHAQNAIINRIKVEAKLDIAERRLPQDGNIRYRIGKRDVDIRLSTTPTVHGERIVMRLLDKTTTVLELSQIGFDDEQRALIEKLIDRPHGIILVTGPTGSGKTTTLYAALSKINKPDLNIMTIEDPVEYQIAGISQTPVNSKIELTFARGLRAFLRQDPDVIMVGEIRDRETAEIAIQASLTGHLVFSTVHTNDAAGSTTRLIDMGVEPFLVASSLVAAIAQRLARRVCSQCRVPHKVTRDELVNTQLRDEFVDELLRTGTFFQARDKGCDACNYTGYRGRMGIYEIMLVDEVVRQMILRKEDSNAIKHEAMRSQGMVLLREDGIRKAARGTTTLEEVMRVTEEDAA